MPRSKNLKSHADELSIDEFLNAKSIYSLQQLSSFWSNREHPWHSKLELIRQLRGLMLNRTVVAERVRELPSGCIDLLRHILKGTHKAFIDPRRVLFYEDLQGAGFIDMGPDRRYVFMERLPEAIIPGQFREILVDVLEVDTRLAAQVLSLERHVQTLPPEQYEKLVSPFLLGAARNGTLPADLRLLAQPARVNERIAALPPDLRDVLRNAIMVTGGIDRVPQNKDRTSMELRQMLEANLIGTVSELPVSLFNRPIIIVFTELTDAMLYQQFEPATKYDTVLARGTAALMELNCIIQQLATDGVRTKMGGGMYKSSLRRLASCIGPEDVQWDKDSLTESYIDLLYRLGLLKDQDEEILPSDGADAWFALSPEDQLARIAARLMDVHVSTSKYLWGMLMEEVKKLPLDNPLHLAILFSRVILRIIKDIPARSDLHDQLGHFHSMEDMVQVLHSWVRVLAHYGIVDVYLDKEVAVAAKLTEHGALALGRPVVREEEPNQKILIVNPDFEVIVFRHGPDWRVAATLGLFAERIKVDLTTYHFKIARQNVEAGVLCGMSAEGMLGFLQQHSRTPIPQNIEYSIRDWAGKVQVARTFSAIVLEVKDAATLDLLMEDPVMKGHVIRRLSPTLATVKAKLINKKQIDHLRQNGIYFRK